MIPFATLDAAARVADYAARRRIVLVPRPLPAPWPLGAAVPRVKADAPGVDADTPQKPEPHPQGRSEPQRIISA